MEGENFAFRNAVCDFYLEPVNEFSALKYGRPRTVPGKPPTLLTVMRIFGITSNGAKCCAHIHGFLPYILLRAKSAVTEEFRVHLTCLIAEVVAQSPFGSSILVNGGDAVYGIFEERRTSVYGYCESDHFIRIVFYDPRIAKLCTYAFQKESSTSKSADYLQPFNAHFPVVLQFFIDFSLHGMDMIHVRRRYSRHPLAGTSNDVELPSPLRPIANTALEFDVFTDDILNPAIVKLSPHKLSGLAFIWEEERRRCELLGMQFQAPTPGDVGVPELWTPQEESRKKELRQVLETIRGASQTTQSQSVSTPHFQPQTLSQAVIDDLRGAPAVSTDLVSEFEVKRLGAGRLTRDWCAILENEDDADFEEPEQIDDGNCDFEDDNLDDLRADKATKARTVAAECVQQHGGPPKECAVIVEYDSEDVITLDDDDDENGFEEGRKNDGLVGRRTPERVQRIERRNLVDEIYENAYTPSISTAMRLDETSDENHQNDEHPLVEPVTGFGERDFANESTWNPADTFIDTPSHFDMAAPTPAPCTDTQKAYNKLMSTVKYSVEHFCVISLEILALSSDPDTRPIADPKLDYIWAIFYAIDEDVCNRCSGAVYSSSQAPTPTPSDNGGGCRPRQFRGVIALDSLRDAARTFDRAHNDNVRHLLPIFVSHEMQMFAELTNIVQRYDPDMLIGYDSKRFSWGYLVERAEFLGIPFRRNISRIKAGSKLRREVTAPPHGRMQIEVWRIAKRESASLRCYRFTSVVKSILKRSFPELDPKWVRHTLMTARQQKISGVIDTILRHYLDKCEMNIDILDALDVFIRTSQMARVYGITVTEVMTRGSQFRVESFLLRLAARDKMRFVAPSVSALQRNLMDSPETIPLNLEPESGVYYDPVVVLDFQSLYPSVCIAHNYCYTTCVGKLSRLKELASGYVKSDPSVKATMTLGALTSYEPCDARQLLKWLDNDQLSVSPTGGVFLKASVRQSLIAQMLTELLDTRVMVKKAMKAHAKCEILKRLLDARQLALKLVANTTYGYMAANWSGRMPCEELADAVVGKGREALERAIATIHENSEAGCVDDGLEPKYGNARVIYGDTDSLFILFEGYTREEAFRIGEQIAADVTAQNPYPMKLKFEKVMHPCALITKKRYVGLSYEHVDQTRPTFDAKGIETVRRDNCDFVSKTLEQVLNLLFGSQPICRRGEFRGGGLDAALGFIKYRLRHIRGIAPSEFVMNAEFRDGYSDRTVIPVKKIAEEAISLFGERGAPIRGERLSYIIAVNTSKGVFTGRRNAGGDGVTAHAVAVDNFFGDTSLEPHYDYYVTRQLFPALQRFLQFFNVRLRWRNGAASRSFCLGCLMPNKYPFCKSCLLSCSSLTKRRVLQSRQYARTRQVCRTCICAAKSVQNIEDVLGATRCRNVMCANRQALAISERQLRPAEFRRHIQAMQLDAISDF